MQVHMLQVETDQGVEVIDAGPEQSQGWEAEVWLTLQMNLLNME